MQQPQQNEQRSFEGADSHLQWQQGLQLQEQQLLLQRQLQQQYRYPHATSPPDDLVQGAPSLKLLQQKPHLQRFSQTKSLQVEDRMQHALPVVQRNQQESLQQEYLPGVQNDLPDPASSQGLTQLPQQQPHQPQKFNRQYWHKVHVEVRENVPPPLRPRQLAPVGEDTTEAPAAHSAAAAALAAALHPRKTDMGLFLRRLGGRYATEMGHEETALTAQLHQLQQELNRVQVLMGKGTPPQQQREPAKLIFGFACLEAAVAAAIAGADVAATLQQQAHQPLHGDTILSEMATFQDLVSDEHKEKKKGFRSIASKALCLLLLLLLLFPCVLHLFRWKCGCSKRLFLHYQGSLRFRSGCCSHRLSGSFCHKRAWPCCSGTEATAGAVATPAPPPAAATAASAAYVATAALTWLSLSCIA